MQPPTAVATPAGGIYAVISGQVTGLSTDPFNGLNAAAGPGTWTLAPQSFGHAPLTEASNAVVETALLANGQLITVWRSATTLLFQIGVTPSSAPTNITPTGLGDSPVIAVDRRSGAALIAYNNVSKGRTFQRQLYPTLGAPQLLPPAKSDAPTIAARIGGGIYTAYTPDFLGVRLLRFGGRAARVPVPRGANPTTAGVATAPNCRLWIYYGNATATYVTRTNNAATRFERVRKLRSPPRAVQYFRLEGEGSAGPLDLFADVTVDGATKDGSYYTHVLPSLSIAVSRGPYRRVIVRVLDAGDPVPGARVSGVSGVARNTDDKGKVSFKASPGGLSLRASKPGYLGASARLTVP